MEYVAGQAITAFADQHRLTIAKRLDLFLQVCDGVQHAHQKGLLHRDLKPGNILVADQDGHAVAKVIDFGITKAIGQRLTGETRATQFGVLVGTPEYMSPEQASFMDADVDTRTDIFSLGLVLYELLVGAAPFDAVKPGRHAVSEILRVIREEEFPRLTKRLASQGDATRREIARRRQTEPKTLARLLRGDLEWITARAIEKEPAHRYPSASELAADTRRFLANEPVEAGPPSTGYRMRRFTRKHRKSLAVAAALLAMLVAGVVVSTWQALRATRAEQRAVNAAVLMEAERDRSRFALTLQVAERLDGDLRRLEDVGRVLAATVAQRTDWQERDLERWMRVVLEQNERIFGMAVAFEPHQPIGRNDFSLYAFRGTFRGTNDVETKHLLPPSYVPIYREWEWYLKPIQEQRVVWSEPYVDVGGSNIPMVTVSTPIRREAVLIGVLRFDLSVLYSNVLGRWLKDLQIGDNSYGFVLSQSGVMVSHPFPDYDFAHASPGKAPQRISDLGHASFMQIANLIQQKRSGSGTAIDPLTGNLATFLFAPVPSADWTFVAVVQ